MLILNKNCLHKPIIYIDVRLRSVFVARVTTFDYTYGILNTNCLQKPIYCGTPEVRRFCTCDNFRLHLWFVQSSASFQDCTSLYIVVRLRSVDFARVTTFDYTYGLFKVVAVFKRLIMCTRDLLCLQSKNNRVHARHDDQSR